ncbi:MAG: diguanylate cyclase [Magnetospirillum sp.]|nr:diguanylate cyclase [Magnetospirillum sp.]
MAPRPKSSTTKPGANPEIKAIAGAVAGEAEVLQAIIDNLPCGVTLFGPNMDMIACNSLFSRLLDFPPDLFSAGLPSLRDLAIFNAGRGEYGPGDPEALADEVVRRALIMEPHAFERTRPDGTILEIQGIPIDGGGFISTYTDITKRRRAEEALRRNQAQLRLIYDTSSVAIFFVNSQGIITHANRRMSEMFACPMDKLEGSEYVAHIHPSEREIGRAKMLALLASDIPNVNLERHYWRDDGSEFWGNLTGQRMHDEDGHSVGLVGVIADVTERRLAELALAERSRELEELNRTLAASNEELREARLTLESMALHDQLTGLANRHKFLQTYLVETERRNRSATPLSLLLVDVDHFKSVNDRFGHLAGDSCLRAIASVLERSVRTADLVGRFGGEEFLVLLPDTDTEGARAAAENLRREIRAAEFNLDGQPVTLTISIGTATLLPGQPADFDTFVQRADSAVYRAKATGRDTVVMGESA